MSYIFGGNTGLSYGQAQQRRPRRQQAQPESPYAAVLDALDDWGDSEETAEPTDLGSLLKGLFKGEETSPVSPAPFSAQETARAQTGTNIGTAAYSGGADPIREGLVSRGMPPHVADAFIVNMRDESALNTDLNERAPIVPGSRGGYGLVQWTGPRRRELEAFAGSRGVPVSDLDMQLDFLMHELGGSESAAARHIFAAPDTSTAAVEILNRFLRPHETHRARRAARYAGL